MSVSASILQLFSWSELKDIEQILQEHRCCDVPVEDPKWPEDELLHRRWTTVDGFPLSISTIEHSTGKVTKFIVARALIERARQSRNWFNARGELLDKSERVNIVECEVVFLSWDQKVYCIPLTRRKYNINRLVKDLLLNKYWGEVGTQPVEFCMPSDGFYWMFKVFKFGNKVLCRCPKMHITGLSGYRGHLSQDNTHTVRGDGEQIHDILSTMAFLFTNEDIDSLRITLQMEDGEVDILLWNDGTVQIYEANCRGLWLQRQVGYYRRILIIERVYREILPVLVQEFLRKKRNNEWTQADRQELAKALGEQIMLEVAKGMDLTSGALVGFSDVAPSASRN